MSNHFAAGLVVFHQDDARGRSYLVIRHSAGHWEFPKGHIEAGETWTETALRELREETGITDANVISDFSRQIQYVYRGKKNQLIHKTDQFGLARVPSQAVRLSDEHLAFDFLEYRLAISRLTHAGTRAILRDAEAFLGNELAAKAASPVADL